MVVSSPPSPPLETRHCTAWLFSPHISQPPSFLLHSSPPLNVPAHDCRSPASLIFSGSSGYSSMDAKHIVDIPDTPDRVRMPIRDGQVECSPISCCSEDSCLVGDDSLNMRGRRNKNASKNDCEGRFFHGRRVVDISEQTGNGRHSSASEGDPAPLFRKVGNKSFKPDGRYHVHPKHADNREDVRLTCSSKPVNRPEHSMGKLQMGGNTHRIQKLSLQRVQKEGKASKSKEDPLASNSLYPCEDPSRAKSSPNKGKAKVNDVVCEAVPDWQNGLCSSRDGGSEQSICSRFSFPGHGVTTSRVSGQKRLVRNGCISPNNIARAKQAVESSSNCTRDFKQASTNKMAKVDPSNVISVDRELTRRSTLNQVKGKEIATYSFSSGQHESETKDLSKRINGAVCKVEPEHGSQTLQSCEKFNPCYNSSHGSSSSSLASEVVPSIDQNYRANTSRRQKKNDLTLNNQDRDEVIFIGSGGKSSSSGSQAKRGPCHPCAVDTVIEIDDSSPGMGCSNPRSDNDMEARARQVEADEMLARELQEQLYHEMPENGSAEQREMDLAFFLQQEENVVRAPRSGSNSMNLGGSSSSQPRRQSRSQLFRNRYQRGGAQARPPTSRLTRLRNSMQHTSRLFPSQMDLDMRIELLEALEAVVSDDISRVTQLLHSDREFTEDDYDMLLTLDENNHEHLGASSAQISSLPESVVQTANNESCPICLEAPVVGETIRHLPCLHKFHKDCIDSWLRRKRSCPVCKSDIT